MDEIKFVHLSDIAPSKLIDLMNNKKVAAQMPLLANGFTPKNCQEFLTDKKNIWKVHGYGPQGFIINGDFAGWGGLQPEKIIQTKPNTQSQQFDADFALVLHPNYWGWGAKIFNKIKAQGFGEFNLPSITILFPPTRLNSKAIERVGFVKDGESFVKGERFVKYRLMNTTKNN